MREWGARQSMLRRRDGDHHASVTTVELFFDLIFVFAITQLSHTLFEHATWLGALEVMLLFMAVWWAWIDTSWVTNWLDPKHSAVRLMLFALMLAGLVMSTSIPKAFETRGLTFALGFAGTQVMRNAFTLWALRRHHAGNYRNFQRIATWHISASCVWVIGGFASPEWRPIIWLIALTIDVLGPPLFFHVPGLGRSTLADWDVEGAHLAERCGLFVIIALGESVLVTGATFSAMAWNAVTAVAFVTAFIGSLAMWWIYFNIGAEHASERIANSTNPGRLARVGYTYLHVPIIAGVVVAAVSDELLLAHPLGHTDVKTAAATLGGSALFLAGNLGFKRIATASKGLSHMVGLGLLALLIPCALVLPPLAFCAANALVLVIVAVWETRSLGGHPVDA